MDVGTGNTYLNALSGVVLKHKKPFCRQKNNLNARNRMSNVRESNRGYNPPNKTKN